MLVKSNLIYRAISYCMRYTSYTVRKIFYALHSVARIIKNSCKNWKIKSWLELKIARFKKKDSRIKRKLHQNKSLVIFLGDEYSGKTTLLQGITNKSGHTNTINQSEGGTYSGQWWLHDQYVCLEVPSISGQQQPTRNWKRLLKDMHGQLPIQCVESVLIILDVEMLQQYDDTRIRQHITRIRQEIQMIYSEVRCDLPIYLIINKCDKIPGFTQFYADNQATDLSLGFSLGASSVSNRSSMETNIQELNQQQQILQLAKIRATHDIHKKLLILNFPSRFKQLGNTILRYYDLFKEEDYGLSNMPVYGVYFTSTLANAISSQYSGHATDLGASEYQCYFSKHLLKILSQYKGSHITRRQWLDKNSKKIIKTVKVTSLSLVIISLGYNIFAIYHRDTVLNKALTDIGVFGFQRSYSLQSVNSQSDFEVVYDDYQRLKSGFDSRYYRAIADLMGKTIFLYIDKMVMPRYVEENLRALSEYHQHWQTWSTQERDDNQGEYYSTLRNLQMLVKPAHLEPAVLGKDIANSLYPPSISEYTGKLVYPDIFTEYFKDYQQQGKYLRFLNSYYHKIVKQAQTDLADSNSINRYYGALKTILKKACTTSRPLITTGNIDDSPYILSKAPNCIYTKAAIPKIIIPAITEFINSVTENDWVLYDDVQPHALTTEEFKNNVKAMLYHHYIDEYIHAWGGYIQAIDYHRYFDYSQASKALQSIPSKHSVMTSIVHVVHDNFSISDLLTDAKEYDKARLKKIVDDSQLLLDKDNPYYKDYLANISKVQAEIENYAYNQTNHAELLAKVNAIFMGDAQTPVYSAYVDSLKLKSQLNSVLKNQLIHLYEVPLQSVWSLYTNQSAKVVQQLWQAQIMPQYHQSIQGHFPLANFGSGVDLNALNQFLQPQRGIIWQFIKTHLTHMLVKNTVGYKPAQWLTISMPFTDEFMTAINQADVISQHLFANSGYDLGFGFDILITPNPRLKQVYLQAGNQHKEYTNGPECWQHLHWPDSDVDKETVLSVRTVNDKTYYSQEFQGPWGIFELLKQSSLLHQQGNQITVKWHLGPSHQQYVIAKIRTKSTPSIFTTLLYQHFYLPETMIAT